MKAAELRDMSDEQLQLTLNETCERLFRLRMQAQTERLDAPSELRHHRRLVARIKTVQRARELAKEAKEVASAS
ncbi:MAG: 50S ribosomal protein L29 [Pirellulaceae bacterium]|jgi:large subunit ribosomal protein L29|nr:50S ribosomal protein L29 [Pirellulaceae bacterium]HJN08347.1 50S ribosomal protein L29 [Pirellulaceae bacterium]